VEIRVSKLDISIRGLKSAHFLEKMETLEELALWAGKAELRAAHLSKAVSLRKLSLGRPSLPEGLLAFSQVLKNLRSLYLSGCGRFVDLAALDGSAIEVLAMADSKVLDWGALDRARALKIVRLDNCAARAPLDLRRLSSLEVTIRKSRGGHAGERRDRFSVVTP